jgi:hypothetical protein
MLRPSALSRALGIALCVGFACSDPAGRDGPGTAGAGGAIDVGGGGSGAETAGGDAGGTSDGASAGAGGDGGEPFIGGPGGAGGALEAGAGGALGGAGGSPIELGGAGAGAGAGGTDTAAGGSGGEGGETPLGPPVAVTLGEFSESPAPDPLNPKLVPAIEELFAAPSVMNGGSTILGIRTGRALDPPRFLVSIADEAGHYVVEASEVDQGDNLYELGLQIARYVEVPTLTIRVAPMDAHGNIGAYQNVVYSLIHVGRGAVSVTLTIDQPADLDVSVIEPSGFEVSYQLPVSPTGGQLERDSNASCGLGEGGGGAGGASGGEDAPAANVERVWWPADFAPTGQYLVYVKNYDDCGVAPVTFSVDILNGSTEESYTGRFPKKSIGESILVAEFEHR